MNPETKLKEFCTAWVQRDFQEMHGHCHITWKDSRDVAELKKILYANIKSFKVGKVDLIAPIICDVVVWVKFNNENIKLTARLVKEEAPFNPSEEGTWGVNPVSLIRNLYKV